MIERSVVRLPVRRRRQLLAADDERRFGSLSIMQLGVAGPLGLFGIATVLVYGLDWLLARILDSAARLGLQGAFVVGIVVTAVVMGVRAFLDRRALPRALDTRALRAALETEQRLAGERPTETERVGITAERAWSSVAASGELELLVLDGGRDGVACLRGPALRTLGGVVPPRLAIETLRFTHAIVSLASRGGRIVATPLSSTQRDAILPTDECVVFPLHSLPPALVELVRPRAIDYR